MKTTYVVFYPDGTETAGECEMKEQPTYDEINAVVRPLIRTLLTKSDYFEHVTVLHEGERRDMFVDDEGQAKNLDRNEKATTVYRHNWLTAHPETEPETVPYIYGDAVLFGRRIWY